MIDYPALAAMAAIAREGSFERAAGLLGITPSAVSQRVRGLEDRLGAILIVRGQPCRPTELGMRLLGHYDKVRLLEVDLAADLGGRTGAGVPPVLGIAVNADSLATWFPAPITEFGRNTGVSIRLVLGDEGQTADRLRRGEVLAAVTADPGPVPGCRTIALGGLRYVACASPAFMAEHLPNGLDPGALAAAPVLRFNEHDRLQALWAAMFGADTTGPVHWVPSTHAFVDFVLAGAAWGLQPLSLAAPHLESGRLVQMSPGRFLDVDLYWVVERLASSVLVSLTKAVDAAARKSLVQARAVDRGDSG